MAGAASAAPSLNEEERVIPPAAQLAEEPRRLVRLSSGERRAGETELTYETRSNWLANFRSFKQRAEMSDEQHELFMQVLADTQQEAVLGWQEMEAAGKEIRGTKDADWSTVPTIRSLSESMNADLLARLRTILTHKQMVSFRKTSMLPRALGYGLFKPLEFTVDSEPAGAE